MGEGRIRRFLQVLRPLISLGFCTSKCHRKSSASPPQVPRLMRHGFLGHGFCADTPSKRARPWSDANPNPARRSTYRVLTRSPAHGQRPPPHWVGLAHASRSIGSRHRKTHGDSSFRSTPCPRPLWLAPEIVRTRCQLEGRLGNVPPALPRPNIGVPHIKILVIDHDPNTSHNYCRSAQFRGDRSGL